MYKLFLTLRYLTRKAIVIFPILVVWLCVSMMIIVASIMGGFVDHVKQANRDLMGDVIISTKSGYGFPNYEAMQKMLATLKAKDGQPLVEVSTPLIKSYGLINFPDYGVNNFAQIVGVEPAGRTATTGFRQTLYRQYSLPTQVTEILSKTGLPATGQTLTDRAAESLNGVGTSVTGTLELGGGGPNLFDPASGAVPAGYENTAGTTVKISSLQPEFGFARAADRVSADLTGTALSITCSFAGPTPPFKMTFANSAFASVRKTFDDFPGAGVTGDISGKTITVAFAGAAGPGNYSASFSIGGPNAMATYTAAAWELDVALNPTLATEPVSGRPPTPAGTAPAKPAPTVTGRALEKLKDTLDTAQVNLYLAERVHKLATTLDPGHTYASANELAARLVPAAPSFDISPAALAMNNRNPADPPIGCIPAVGIGMYHRDRHGDFLRPPELEDLFCELTVVPLSRRGMTIEPQHGSFVVVDDTYTQVIDVDSTYVFAPFEKIQKLALMDAGPDGAGGVLPARCTELQLKTHGHSSDGDIDHKTLLENRDLIDDAVQKFIHQPQFMDTASHGIDVETWDQKQALYIAAVENEKGLITFILGLMSLVVVVVIFLIFYMIVRDKTRDIGIIKALGGSEAGVMSIFMLYGTFIGVVGGLAGTLTGVVFVWNTNFIHDKIIYGIFGVMIWRRDIYLFDKIPDTVHPREVAAYFAAAVVAGFLGATLPAVLAAYQDPVKAVRYE